jgi:hypothetical protein
VQAERVQLGLDQVAVAQGSVDLAGADGDVVASAGADRLTGLDSLTQRGLVAEVPPGEGRRHAAAGLLRLDAKAEQGSGRAAADQFAHQKVHVAARGGEDDVDAGVFAEAAERLQFRAHAVHLAGVVSGPGLARFADKPSAEGVGGGEGLRRNDRGGGGAEVDDLRIGTWRAAVLVNAARRVQREPPVAASRQPVRRRTAAETLVKPWLDWGKRLDVAEGAGGLRLDHGSCSSSLVRGRAGSRLLHWRAWISRGLTGTRARDFVGFWTPL